VLGDLFAFVPGAIWLVFKISFLLLFFLWFRATFPTLSLRSDHATGLENIYPGDAGLAAGHRAGCAGSCESMVRLSGENR
jgi:hypothetical protein